MKKFIFSLEKVLSYKRQILGLLKSELSRLQVQQNEIQRKIEDTNHEFKVTSQKLTDEMRDGLSSHTIAVYKGYLDKLNRKVLSLLKERQKLSDAITAKQREIVQMNSDISGLERLKDKQFGEYSVQERKEQETFIEEFVSHASNRAG